MTFKNLWNIDGLIPKTCLLNLIVVGDSDYEFNAATALKKEIDTHRAPMICLLKVVKVEETSTPERLEFQLAEFNRKFEGIASSQSSSFTMLVE